MSDSCLIIPHRIISVSSGLRLYTCPSSTGRSIVRTNRICRVVSIKFCIIFWSNGHNNLSSKNWSNGHRYYMFSSSTGEQPNSFIRIYRIVSIISLSKSYNNSLSNPLSKISSKISMTISVRNCK